MTVTNSKTIMDTKKQDLLNDNKLNDWNIFHLPPMTLSKCVVLPIIYSVQIHNTPNAKQCEKLSDHPFPHILKIVILSITFMTKTLITDAETIRNQFITLYSMNVGLSKLYIATLFNM
jgi:hypothetical protein